MLYCINGLLYEFACFSCSRPACSKGLMLLSKLVNCLLCLSLEHGVWSSHKYQQENTVRCIFPALTSLHLGLLESACCPSYLPSTWMGCQLALGRVTEEHILLVGGRDELGFLLNPSLLFWEPFELPSNTDQAGLKHQGRWKAVSCSNKKWAAAVNLRGGSGSLLILGSHLALSLCWGQESTLWLSKSFLSTGAMCSLSTDTNTGKSGSCRNRDWISRSQMP